MLDNSGLITALGASRFRCPQLQVFQNLLLEESFDQIQNSTVGNALPQLRHQPFMADALKVALQIRVHHPCVAGFEQPLDASQRILASLPDGSRTGVNELMLENRSMTILSAV